MLPMKAIETTAVFESPNHLRLAREVELASGEIRVVILYQENSPTKNIPDFEAAIGSYYRDYPDEPIRTADELLGELREGESA